MRYIDEYRDKGKVEGLLNRIKSVSKKRMKIMEVCGSHTVAIFKNGIKGLLPENIDLISGPGCPVCVTSVADVDRAIKLAKEKGVIFTTFGDMMRVPGSNSSLEEERAKGADIRMVYSPLEALKTAKVNPSRKVIFYAVGFETTSPSIASSILKAKENKVENFYIFSVHKLIPPAMKALVNLGEIKIDGFICPGHVSSLIGSKPYRFLAEAGCSAVISGFEPVDIVQTIYMLVKQVEDKKVQVEIQYKRGVSEEGNRKAMGILYEVFEKNDAYWRGIGIIPKSGLKLKKEFKNFDANEIFDIKIEEGTEPEGCACGEILRGLKKPNQCPLFKKVCNPTNPVGPCMVSSEGSCAAYYKYS